MISKRFYLNLIIRVSLIVVLSVFFGYLITSEQSLRFSLLCLLLIIYLTISLIFYLNRTNKKISFFFDSVRNDDSSLSFPLDEKDSSLREIYKGMNKVNQQIKKLKIENRSQEQYFQILLEHLATGIITYNDKGFILHANSSARKLLATDVLTHLKQIERIDKKLFKAINTIKPSEHRLIAFSTEIGEIQLSLKATSFKSDNSELVILSIQDIKSELDEKEVESWMKLIRVLMHEIMNSITPITSLSESLFQIYNTGGEPVLPEKVTNKTIATTLQGLNVIKEQGKGLMSFVESYRKLTRVPEPEKKLFKVSDLISRVKVLYHSIELSDNTQLSDDLDIMTMAVRDAIGYKIIEEETKFKVTNIRYKFPQIFDWLNFQDINVIIIIILMLVVAGFNMISGLLILILEKTNMIGILKALGSEDNTIRKMFMYQASYLIGKGLLWGNLIGIGLAYLQLKTSIITLDPSSYYLKTVPINLDLTNIILLNAGTMAVIIIMLLVPSQLISRITPVKAIRYD